ncbi:FeoB-associated Cys-rich membrane protein [Flavobacterium zhairuonense]|nr:FeoB-associated Cys-rich membrane protein [Flavobacterium zhairuonense]KAF2515536.1 FeoB-associated Cys-rich membrane protein [Flavobacterium zhairuonense]
MMVQEIIAFAILGFAVAFLIKKFFWKSKKKKDCGDGNCGCS